MKNRTLVLIVFATMTVITIIIASNIISDYNELIFSTQGKESLIIPKQPNVGRNQSHDPDNIIYNRGYEVDRIAYEWYDPDPVEHIEHSYKY